MIRGYARVSTETVGKQKRKQKPDLQVDAIRERYPDAELYIDTISGAAVSRPELDRMLSDLEQDDTVVVWALDRLGRSTVHLITLITSLHEAGVTFVSLKESLDTSSAMGRCVIAILAAIAEMERERMKERTRAGMAAARARGVTPGPARMLSDEQVALGRSLVKNGRPVSFVCRVLKCSRATWYREQERRQDAISGESR